MTQKHSTGISILSCHASISIQTTHSLAHFLAVLPNISFSDQLSAQTVTRSCNIHSQPNTTDNRHTVIRDRPPSTQPTYHLHMLASENSFIMIFIVSILIYADTFSSSNRSEKRGVINPSRSHFFSSSISFKLTPFPFITCAVICKFS